MKSFKQYLLENSDEKAVGFTSGDHVWVIDPHTGQLVIRAGISHKEAFPHLFDPDGEPTGGVEVHGRIEWNPNRKGTVSIITAVGGRKPPTGDSVGFLKGHRKMLENDVFTRIRALEEIENHFKDYGGLLQIHHGARQNPETGKLEMIYHTPQEHKKHLMGLLAE